MKVAIIGSRECQGLTAKHLMNYIPKGTTTIVSGGAMGVDTLAREVAKLLKIPIQEFLPNYEIFGKKAPLIRNSTIIDSAEIVLAFWDGYSNGTKHAISYALNKEMEIQIFYIEDILKLD